MTEKAINPNKCVQPFFIPIFQPIVPPNDRTKKLVELVKSDLKKNNIHDLSYLKAELNFTDFIHVDQPSKEIIAKEITQLIKNMIDKENKC